MKCLNTVRHRVARLVSPKEPDRLDLEAGDFRTVRRYLAPWLFATSNESERRYPPPNDVIPNEPWDHLTTLPTDVLLKSTSYDGSLIARLTALESDWIFSWPGLGEAPFMEEVALLAGEEFDALVFNAAHGWYRQALGCLRNALEILIFAASLAVTHDTATFTQWRAGQVESKYRPAREAIRDSIVGRQIDADAAPASVFGDHETSWTRARYKRLCAYAHSQAGYNNADFWESNGPVYRPRALRVVEDEFRETLALSYLLLRLGWPSYTAKQGERNLLSGPRNGWNQYGPMLEQWLDV